MVAGLKELTEPVRVVVGVLVPAICGPGSHWKPKPRLVDPWLEIERKRKARDRAYGLPEEPEAICSSWY